MKVVSLFSGCGGMDLGFKKAGFDIAWANEKDSAVWETYKKNHKSTILDKRNITHVLSNEIPDAVGIIGGPPCQSWSAAGKGRGMGDERGKMFLQFLRIVKDKKPHFFLIENVAGMVSKRHIDETNKIISKLKRIGYDVTSKLLNSKDYGVPQSRRRLFIIGFRKDLNIKFSFPAPAKKAKNVKDAIYDLRNTAVSEGKKTKAHNHEYIESGYSYIFMSRNRVLNWQEPSFTVQANGRHASLHPSAPKMQLVKKDVRRFEKGKEHLYRRLTVRESARLQTFPNNFIFHYKNINDGYKMVGNAVPVELAYQLAKCVKISLTKARKSQAKKQ